MMQYSCTGWEVQASKWWDVYTILYHTNCCGRFCPHYLEWITSSEAEAIPTKPAFSRWFRIHFPFIYVFYGPQYVLPGLTRNQLWKLPTVPAIQESTSRETLPEGITITSMSRNQYGTIKCTNQRLVMLDKKSLAWNLFFLMDPKKHPESEPSGNLQVCQ